MEEQECTEMHRDTYVGGTYMQCTKLQHPLLSIIINHHTIECLCMVLGASYTP